MFSLQHNNNIIEAKALEIGPVVHWCQVLELMIELDAVGG